MLTRRAFAAGAGVAVATTAKTGRAIEPLRLAVLNDLAGPYADIGGPGSVVAARMAVADSGGSYQGSPIEILVADHQQRPDLGVSLARNLYDVEKVAALFDLPNSAIALSVAGIAREKNKVAVICEGLSTQLTGSNCSPNTVQWTMDNYALARSTVVALMKAGGDSWFFITADYAFGRDLEAEASSIVRELGGKVVGSVRHPFPGTTDFASYLLQAQSSGAKVIALANATADFQNALKQAAEFGLGRGAQRVAGLAVYLPDIDALGLATAQGTVLSLPFYWDLNDGTRAFSRRFAALHKDRMPTVYQASVYSGVLHFLKAANALGSAVDGRAMVAKMKEIPVDDPVFGHGKVRANGLNVHSMYLLQVKTPAESSGRWDYLKSLAEIPADQAFKSLAASGCQGM